MTADQCEGLAKRAIKDIDLPASLADWREELIGAAMLGIAEAVKRYDGATESLMVERARSRAVDELRSEMRRRGLALHPDGSVTHRIKREMVDPYKAADVASEGEPTPPANLEECELHEQVKALVAQLPEAERQVIQARYYTHPRLTLEELAKVMGKPAWKLERLHRRAVARLKSVMVGSDEREGPRGGRVERDGKSGGRREFTPSPTQPPPSGVGTCSAGVGSY